MPGRSWLLCNPCGSSAYRRLTVQLQASPKVGLAGPLSEDWRLRLCLAFGFSFAGFAFGSPRFGFVWALWQ